MKQHLLKFFALFVCAFLFTNLNAQVTINYEQEGAGEPFIEYFNYDIFNTDKIMLVPGESYPLSGLNFRNQYINGQWVQCYWFTVKVVSQDKLKSVIVDDVENNEYLNSAKSNGEFSFILTENKEYNIKLKLVYEGEYVEKQWTQKINTSVAGLGTVKCTYEDKTNGEQTVTLENRSELQLDVKPGEDGKYRMRIIGEPEGEKVVRFITVNGADVKKSYDENGYYDIVVDAEKATTNLIVEFGDAPRADMIIKYQVTGDGTTDYYYFSDMESTDKKEGAFVVGENLLNEMYFSDEYCLYVVPKPDEDASVESIKINGVADSSKKEQYEENGYFTMTAPAAGETYMLTIGYTDKSIKYNKVTLKANGDIVYSVSFSDVMSGINNTYYVENEDIVLEYPDNISCSWSYLNAGSFVVKGLQVNGAMVGDMFTISGDTEIELVYVPATNCAINVSDYSNGEVSLEKEEFSMDKGDFVYVPLAEGEEVVVGTGVRVTAYADPGYEIKEFKVNGELKLASTPDNSEYEYAYVAELWEDLNIDVTFALMASGIDAVASEPVKMNIYSVDGVLVKTCVAATVEEAVEGLNNGLYIVNGKKVVVSKSER